jgi:hypothetical protein
MFLWFRLGAIGAAALGVFLIVIHYQNLRAEAAKVPELEKQISDMEIQAQDALASYLSAEAGRKSAEARLTDWQTVRNDVVASIRRELRNAPVATNPVCAPTDDERRMFNDAVSAIFAGNAGSEIRMP